MNLTTVGMIIIGVSGTLLAGMAALIKTMILGRLDVIQGSVDRLTEASNDHGQQLVRHETILEMNGLTERRKFTRDTASSL